MNITTIAEHTVCLDLLPEKAKIIDAGCRGFAFTNELRNLGHDVYPIDCDKLPESNYFQYALSHVQAPYSIITSPDPQATKIEINNFSHELTHTIESFSKVVGVDKWDLIKLDIEGAEFEILEEAKHPIANQVSVEFHAHCTNQTKAKIDQLLQHMSNWYTIHNQVWESKHGCQPNYWDILLVSKKN